MKIFMCPYCKYAIEYNTFINDLEYTIVEEIDMETGETVNKKKVYDYGTEVLCTSCGRKTTAIDWLELEV